LLHPPTALWRREALAASRGTFWVRMDGASSLRIYKWARCVGPDGLVVGLDISAAMLARAAKRVAEVGLANVLLLRADAQALPFADATLRHVSCAGGLHQLPDLPRALAEMARVSRDGGVLTASTFIEPRGALAARVAAWTKRRLALHLIPLPQL